MVYIWVVLSGRVCPYLPLSKKEDILFWPIWPSQMEIQTATCDEKKLNLLNHSKPPHQIR